MSLMKNIFRQLRLGYAVLAVALGLAAWAAVPAPAAARVVVGIGVGVPFPGYYAPYPYYPYPPPYYYPPPPPPAAYYPPPGGPMAGGPAPAEAPVSESSITYTQRPAWRNASGQSCREVQFASGGTGTACEDGSGQWRISP